MSTASIKSVNFAQHGAIGATLTDQQIEEYMLRGHYGKARQQEILDDIRHGRTKRLDKAIRAGHYGQPAQAALAERRRKEPEGSYGSKVPFLSPQLAEKLASLGIDINSIA